MYIRALEPRVPRPDRELVGFVKVTLEAGQQETVEVELGAAATRYWDVDTHGWRIRPGRYEVLVGSSSRRHRGDRRHHADVTSRPWTLVWDRLLVEPRRPAVIREQPNAYWFAVAAVCVGAFMGQLDASIVTVALPTLQHTFDASVGAVTWVGLSYLLVLVATVTAVGRFADMWGRKLLYVYGFVIFTLASVLCGLAPGLAALCGFRALQAVGAAMLQANSLAIIVLVDAGPVARARPSGSRARPRRWGSRWAPRSAACCSPRAGGASSSSSTCPSGSSARWRRSCWCPGAGT